MTLSTSPFASSPISSSLLSSCISCCLTPSTSLISWITTTRTSAEELGPLDKKNSSTGYAHHQHRRIIKNPGNFGDYMKGRIRFMTAITPAYAHAYQATCLARHMPAVPHQHFRLPKLKGRNPNLPNARSTTRTRGTGFRGWSIYTDGGTRVENGETFAGWCVIARSLHGRIHIMFDPVVITEAHLAFSGARTH